MIPQEGSLRASVRSIEFSSVNQLIAEKFLNKFTYELSEGSAANLAVHRDRLSRTSVVVYFNHFTRDDPFLAGALAVRRLSGSLTGMTVPIGARHFREYGAKSLIHSVVIHHTHLLGIELCPVPQPYYINRNDYNFSASELTSMQRNFIKSAKRVLGNQGGLLLIAPEGTRSPDGGLLEAQPGIEHFNRYGSSVHFSPWAVVPTGPYDREEGLGPVEVRIGAPMTKDEIEARWREDGKPNVVGFTDKLMVGLAELLPFEMRGVYANRT